MCKILCDIGFKTMDINHCNQCNRMKSISKQWKYSMSIPFYTGDHLSFIFHLSSCKNIIGLIYESTVILRIFAGRLS